MANFDKEFEKLILAEGVYGNDPDDSGGETFLGISRVHNPKWIGWKTIDDIKKIHGTKNLTKVLKTNESLINSAKVYYKMRYWDIFRLDEIPNQKIAHEMFDTCVNMGSKSAILIAQQVIGMTTTGVFNDELFYNLKRYK